MSNMDANGLLFEGYKSIPQNTDERILPTYVSWWSSDIGDKNKFLISTKYKVKGNIFNVDNWERQNSIYQ